MLWASLVVRWLRIHLPMQGTWVFQFLGQGSKDTRWRKYKDTGKTESWKTVTSLSVKQAKWHWPPSSRALFYCCDWFCGWFLGGWASGRQMFVECLLGTLLHFLNIWHLTFSQQPHKVHVTSIVFGIWNQICLVNDVVYFPWFKA